MVNSTCIKLKAIDQALTIVHQPVLASGDVGTTHVKYDLDCFWDGYALTGTFYASRLPSEVYEQPLTDGTCVIPWEVLQDPDILYIGLRGVNGDGLVKTAAPIRYRIVKGSPCGTDTPREPTPDVYQQLLDKTYAVESMIEESAIVCEASGETVTIADASDQPLRGLKLFGKSTQVTTTGANLIPFPYYELISGNGIEWTINADGTVTANGTAEGGNHALYLSEGLPLNAGNYVLHGAMGNDRWDVSVSLYYQDDKGEYVYLNAYGNNGVMFTLSKEAKCVLYLQVFEGATVSNLVFKPMLNVGTTALPYEPYTGGKPSPSPEYPQEINSTVVNKVTSVGANLIPFPYVSWNRTSNGVTFTMQDDGGVYISGTTTAETYYILEENVDYGEENAFWNIGLTRQMGDYWITNISYNATTKVLFMILPPSTKFDATYYPMMNYGTTALPYEPYKGGSATLAQPVTLCGIPVSSGGNYTDANGQHWLCDEMDFARGVYVQRVGRVDLGTLSWTRNAGIHFYSSGIPATAVNFSENVMCTAYKVSPKAAYDSDIDKLVSVSSDRVWITDSSVDDDTSLKASLQGTMLYYELETPLETPISETDLTAYRTLHTNKPNTTVYTDSNAGMTVAYAADTKTYIDNKFAELAAAVLQNA